MYLKAVTKGAFLLLFKLRKMRESVYSIIDSRVLLCFGNNIIGIYKIEIVCEVTGLES